MSHLVGNITLGVPLRATDWTDLSVVVARYAPRVRLAPHTHEFSYLSLVLRGGFEERVGSDAECARSASVVCMPSGVAHGESMGPSGARSLLVALRPAFLSELPAAWHRLDRWRWFHGGPVTRLMLRLYQEYLLADEMTPCGVCERVLGLFEVIAGDPERPIDKRPRCVSAAVELLRTRGTRGARLGEMAAELGKDPAYLARAFRRQMGCTMSAYRRRVWVREAADRLASTDASLIQVALDAGFADQSHMCRVFKAEMGLTPQAYRALAGPR
jgi:AraC family transcriptional regulator